MPAAAGGSGGGWRRRNKTNRLLFLWFIVYSEGNESGVPRGTEQEMGPMRFINRMDILKLRIDLIFLLHAFHYGVRVSQRLVCLAAAQCKNCLGLGLVMWQT
jgi:hypothetical protein